MIAPPPPPPPPPPDTTPPETAVDSGPPPRTKSRTALFTFSADEIGSTFECSLNAAAFTTCVSPTTYTSLADGSYTFQVRAKDAAQNVDPSPAGWTWVVDNVAPNTTIDSHPPATTAETAATFTFSASEPSTFECDLDHGDDGAGFAACSSPKTYTGLAVGSHNLRILATDLATDFYRTITEKLLTYALGRGLEYYDVATVDAIVERLQKAGGRPSALLAGIIESAPFQKTRNVADTVQQRADLRTTP